MVSEPMIGGTMIDQTVAHDWRWPGLPLHDISTVSSTLLDTTGNSIAEVDF